MCFVFAFTGTKTALLINTNYIIRQSTNFPPTVNWYSTNNWNRIDRMLTSILAKTNTRSTYRSICRLTFGQVLADMPAKMSANTSADISTDSQLIWQLRVSWYGSWHVDQVVANRVDQYLTMGCSNYTRPGILYCPLLLRIHQKVLKGFSFMICYDGIPITHSI